MPTSLTPGDHTPVKVDIIIDSYHRTKRVPSVAKPVSVFDSDSPRIWICPLPSALPYTPSRHESWWACTLQLDAADVIFHLIISITKRQMETGDLFVDEYDAIFTSWWEEPPRGNSVTGRIKCNLLWIWMSKLIYKCILNKSSLIRRNGSIRWETVRWGIIMLD